VDLRPSIHIRKSGRLKFPLSEKPRKKMQNRNREKIERQKTISEPLTPKPRGTLKKPQKYSLLKIKKTPSYL